MQVIKSSKQLINKTLQDLKESKPLGSYKAIMGKACYPMESMELETQGLIFHKSPKQTNNFMNDRMSFAVLKYMQITSILAQNL